MERLCSFIPFLLCFCVFTEASYPLTLKTIYTSHGHLEPEFDSNIFQYILNLQHAHDEIALTPVIFKNRTEYQPEIEGESHNYPIVTMHWLGHEDEPPEPSALAVRKQIDLPDDKSSLDISIIVRNPQVTKETAEYVVSVQQSKDPLTVLKKLSGVDDTGQTVLVEPVVTQDSLVYTAFVHPEANSVSLTVKCATTDWLQVNGISAQNGGVHAIVRDKTRHKQMVEITCGEGIVTQVFVRYVVQIISDYPMEDIARPRVVVDSTGKDCQYHSPEPGSTQFEPGFFNCPNPKSHGTKTRLIGFLDPTVRYTVESPDEEVQIRLLDELPTIPFTYRSDLMLIATSGRFNVTWPLKFNPPLGNNAMKILGWLLSGLLVLLVLGLVLILAFASMFGLGSPVGTSEVAHGLLFISQYLCFANFIRGSTVLSNLSEGLKWTTGFIPTPWQSGIKLSGALSFAEEKYQSFSAADSHYVGDLADISNAYGCLFWGAALLIAGILFHSFAIMKFIAFESQNTFPHRLLFGHWETRIAHVIAFPMVTASAMILWSWKAALLWKLIAGAVLGVYGVWNVTAFLLIQRVVATKKVVWVWSSSVREDGELEDQSGYWSDVVCDQLNTQPVNRSLFKKSFPWQWVSTVADVEETNILPQYFNRGASAADDYSVASAFSIHPQKEFRKGTNYPMSKAPQTVEVFRTRAPGIFCPGQRLIAGLLRSQWLDILFTFQGLSRFHTEVIEGITNDFIVPLTVKTSQLQGPISTGRFCFFFDGAKIPIIRVLDSLFKGLFGVVLGIAIASRQPIIDFICFAVGGVLALAYGFYVISTTPFSRKMENWFISAMLIVVGCTSGGFALTSLIKKLAIVNDIFLWIVVLASVVLGAYSCVVTFSVFSAVACAPLEESRFLEKLANCTVTIADHNNGWSVDMPAYNKYGARDVKVQCNRVSGRKVHVSVYPSGEEPALEFSVQDIMQACRSGAMKAPVVCLYGPGPTSPLSYRHKNLYERFNVAQAVGEFLAAERTTAEAADQIARQVAHQVESRGKDKMVLCCTVIPPRGLTDPKSMNSQSNRSSETLSRF